MRIRLAALLALLAFVPSAVPGQTAPADPAAAFGARESIQTIRISPDGQRIAYVAPRRGQGSALYVVDLASGQSNPAASADGVSQRLGGCDWVSNQRLVCVVYAMRQLDGEIVRATRLIALDADGQNLRQLGERDSAYQRYARLWGGTVVDFLPGEDGAVLMGQQFVPEQRQNTRLERRDEGYGVVRVDTRNLAQRRVETANPYAVEYISDGHGRVRIMGVQPPRGATGQTGNEITFMFRTADSSAWRPLGVYNELTRQGPRPAAVDRALNAAYVFEKLDGRIALYRVTLDGSGHRDLVASNPQVDIDDLLRIGRSGRVIGATFVTDRRQAIIFDPEMRRLTEQLARAIPNLPLIRIADASEDESKLLIWAGSDTDPGRYYVYDKATRRLAEIMLARPELEGVTLAPVRAVTYRAADGTQIPAYLTLPPGSSRRSSCRTAAPGRATNGASTGSPNISPTAAMRCSSRTSAARQAMATHGSRRTASSPGGPRSATSTTPAAGWSPKGSPIPPSSPSSAGPMEAMPRSSRTCWIRTSSTPSSRSRR
jgi:hypothetical protein